MLTILSIAARPPTTLTTPSAHRSAGYEADQSRFDVGGASNDTATDSTFTASSPRQGGGPSPSLYADREATDQAALNDDEVAETQVVEETPKAVDAMRARESIAALLSDAVMTEHGSEASTIASESLGGPNERTKRAGESHLIPFLRGRHADQCICRARWRDSELSLCFACATWTVAISSRHEQEARPSARRRGRGRDSGQEAESGFELSQERQAARQSIRCVANSSLPLRFRLTRERVAASPTPPPPRADQIEGEEQEPSPSPDRLVDTQDEEVVRRFFALPLDTVVQVGKRIGGSPSLKRLMDLGERAKEYIESFQSGSSS